MTHVTTEVSHDLEVQRWDGSIRLYPDSPVLRRSLARDGGVRRWRTRVERSTEILGDWHGPGLSPTQTPTQESGDKG